MIRTFRFSSVYFYDFIFWFLIFHPFTNDLDVRSEVWFRPFFDLNLYVDYVVPFPRL